MLFRSDEWKAHGLECGALDDELTLRGDEARVRGGGVVTLGDGLKARDVKTGAHRDEIMAGGNEARACNGELSTRCVITGVHSEI